MKSFLLWLVAVALFAAAVWSFHTSSGFLSERDYLAGLLHVLVGLATLRGGVEVSRLAVVVALRAP
ncbi:MAG: hypothetical protein ACQEXJ_15025 [Myxococcota bacterium]